MITKEDIKLFWNQYGKIIPKNTFQLYDALTFTLTKYHSVLKGKYDT